MLERRGQEEVLLPHPDPADIPEELVPRHGFLQAREIVVAVTGRGAAGRERSVRLWLPGRDGVAVADGAVGRSTPVVSPLPGSRLVGADRAERLMGF